MARLNILAILVLIGLALLAHAHGFASTRLIQAPCQRDLLPSLLMSKSGNDQDPLYSQELLLRAEVESPFQKIRFFLYTALGAGATISLFVSLTRIGAALGGINTDLMQESLINAGIDTAGIALLYFLYQRDLKSQQARLKRASKGAELAKLKVTGSNEIMTGSVSSNIDDTFSPSETFTAPLSSFRRGRGIEKRIVLAVAGKDKIDEILQKAKRLEKDLIDSDLLIVPVVLPGGVAPNVDGAIPNCIALPTGFSWSSVMKEEAEEASTQGVDTLQEGFALILKKNGRVGQRTKGIFLSNMVGEVAERKAMGMDVRNI